MSVDMKNNNEEINNDDITIIELEGEKYELIDLVVYNDKKYIAVTPFSEDESEEDPEGDFTILEMTDDPDDEEAEFTLLEVADDPNDEENCILRTVDDDELYARIGEEFLKRFDNIAEDE